MLRQRQAHAAEHRQRRRPPDALLELLNAPVAEHRRLIERLEADPVFKTLRSMGVIRRLAGRMPLPAYQDHMDRELIAFARRHSLDARDPGWVREFVERGRGAGVVELARKYGTPLAETRRIARYLRSIASSRARYEGDAGQEPAPQHETSGALIDDTIIASISAFVREHGVSPEAFRNLFLEGDHSPAVVARTVGARRSEVEAVFAALATLQAFDLGYRVQTAPTTRLGSPEAADEPVAFVSTDAHGAGLVIQFASDISASARYRIDRRLLEDLGEKKTKQVRDVLERVTWLNQAGPLIAQVVQAATERQREFLLSGDPAELRPLTQAHLAKVVGASKSTVCRIMKGRTLRAPWGEVPLRSLCPSAGEVVRALSIRHPDYAAPKLASILAARYGVVLSPRTVAHHRQRGRTRAGATCCPHRHSGQEAGR